MWTRDLIVCGNCKHYGFEFPTGNTSWAYCKLWKKHFPKDIVKMPCYNTCDKFEQGDLEVAHHFEDTRGRE